jgi:hypothetical protein
MKDRFLAQPVPVRAARPEWRTVVGREAHAAVAAEMARFL